MTKIVIAGYYGRDNLGDEAMLAAMAAGFCRVSPDCGLTVISANPSRTAQLHGLPGVGRTDLFGIIRAIRACNLLVVGGGSLLQDVTSQRNLMYYLGICRLGKLLGKPVMLYGNGIGPITSPFGRALTRSVLDRVDLITVRDAESQAELARLGVTVPRVVLTADPVLGLAAGPAEAAGAREAGVLPPVLAPDGHPVVGVSLRPWKGAEGLQDALIQACRSFIEQNGGRILILPMQWPVDVEAAGRLIEALGPAAIVPERPLGVDEMLGLIARLDLVVAVRFHALVMAALVGIPVVGLTYDPKVDNFLNSIGLRSAGSVDRPDPEFLAREMQAAFQGRDHFYQGVSTELERQREAARQNLKLAAELLEPDERRAVILGVEVDRITLSRAMESVEGFIDRAPGPRTRIVVTPNAEMIYLSQADPELLEVLRRADLAVPDGSGVVWASRRVGQPVPERVPGVDLASGILERAARKGYRIYLFGGKPGVAERAAARMREAHPGLKIAGCRNGFFAPQDEPAIVQGIRTAEPDLLLVCLGSPKQEKWIGRHAAGTGAAVAIGLGGFLDVWAGEAERAPLWMRNLGLEWLFRLYREPWRYRRMMVLPKFALAVALLGRRPLRKGV